MAGYIVRDVLHLDTQAAAEPAAAPPPEAADEKALDAVAEMSEAEMNALVAQQLDKLQS